MLENPKATILFRASVALATPWVVHYDEGTAYGVSVPDYADGIWGFVDIDLTPYLGKTEKINVALPSVVIRKVDAKHKNLQGFLRRQH